MPQAMRDMMEENYKRWHQHNEQQLAADVQAAQQKEEENAAAQQRRYGCCTSVLSRTAQATRAAAGTPARQCAEHCKTDVGQGNPIS